MHGLEKLVSGHYISVEITINVAAETQIFAWLKFAEASGEVSDHTQKMIRGGFWPLWDFRASFHGILKKRAVSPDDQSNPHSLPEQKVMPYVLEIDQIDAIQIERATFWTEPPPLR